MVTPVYYMAITELSALIRKRELSPIELTRAHLERIEGLDVKLHAFITVTAEMAFEDARRAEIEICNGIYRGPLHGIPIAYKDIVCINGVRTTAHSLLLKDWVPTETANVVGRLQHAGAVCLGKTSLHEFAFGSPGPDEAFPAARNPWNLDYAPGSSSSGSGAAVAAGLCSGAIGTDTAGSIRHPAAVCGIVGMKPTFGLVSKYGVIPLAPSLDHVGPMTRSVRDNAIMLQAMAGYDPNDPFSMKREVLDFHRLIGKSIRGLQVGVPRRFIESVPHGTEVLDAFDSAIHNLQDLGARMRDIEVAELVEANEVARLILVYEAYQYHKTNLDLRPNEFGKTFKERILKGAQYTAGDYEAARGKAKKLQEDYGAIFSSGIDIIISPGRENPADTMTDLLANPTKRGVTNYMYNLTGLPALTLPMGFSAKGLPIGLQLAANCFREDLIYQLAAAYEDMAMWSKRIPSCAVG